MNTPQVVILAGGLGTRLRPVTSKVPKPIVPVAGHPYLSWQLKDLRRQGIERVLLLVGYLWRQIEETFGDGSELGLEIEYSVEEEPLGTGGAVKHGLDKLEDLFVLLNGDSFLNVNYVEMWKKFDTLNTDTLVAVYDNVIKTPVTNNARVEAERIVAYKKDGGLESGYNFVDAGAYVLKKRLVEEVTRRKFLLENMWAPLIDEKRLGAYQVQERFYDIGTPERLQEFEEKVRDYF